MVFIVLLSAEISIRAPNERSDLGCNDMPSSVDVISIRAPNERSDNIYLHIFGGFFYFNPRSQ